MPRCRYCRDDLPDAPAAVTSCWEWARYQARERGDMLTADEADSLTILPVLCGLDVAIRDGLEELPVEGTGGLTVDLFLTPFRASAIRSGSVEPITTRIQADAPTQSCSPVSQPLR
jgi:hypothetical protein